MILLCPTRLKVALTTTKREKKLEIVTGERANCIEANCNGGLVNTRNTSLNTEQDTDQMPCFRFKRQVTVCSINRYEIYGETVTLIRRDRYFASSADVSNGAAKPL